MDRAFLTRTRKVAWKASSASWVLCRTRWQTPSTVRPWRRTSAAKAAGSCRPRKRSSNWRSVKSVAIRELISLQKCGRTAFCCLFGMKFPLSAKGPEHRIVRGGGSARSTFSLFLAEAHYSFPSLGLSASATRMWQSLRGATSPCAGQGWRPSGARCRANLSETAFLVKQHGHFDLRWFTPKVEVDPCGHATLASAHVLWQQGHATGDEIRFSTRSGILKAIRHGGDIELDFPLKPEAAAQAPLGLLEALGVSAKYVGKNQFRLPCGSGVRGRTARNRPRLQALVDSAGSCNHRH